MSFRCDICDAVQPVRSKPIKIVLETRKVVYPQRTVKKITQFRTDIIVIDNGGQGVEIVEEANACADCAKDRGVE